MRACAAAGVTLATVDGRDRADARTGSPPPRCVCRRSRPGGSSSTARTPATELPAGPVPIEIDAGVAFGSGEHATTQSCLRAIDQLARAHRFRRVLDVGCGSGILAIAAAKCWPARVVAVDNDPVAVRVAAHNLRLNGVAARARRSSPTAIATRWCVARRRSTSILANILADPLIELAPALRRHLAPGGHAVLSGLLDRQAEAVIAAHRDQGLRLVHRFDQGPWTALVLRAPPGRAGA